MILKSAFKAFTLIELLVSLAIFSVIMILITTLISGTLLAFERISISQDSSREAEMLLKAIESSAKSTIFAKDDGLTVTMFQENGNQILVRRGEREWKMSEMRGSLLLFEKKWKLSEDILSLNLIQKGKRQALRFLLRKQSGNTEEWVILSYQTAGSAL